jgi:hypothetical protein
VVLEEGISGGGKILKVSAVKRELGMAGLQSGIACSGEQIGVPDCRQSFSPRTVLKHRRSNTKRMTLSLFVAVAIVPVAAVSQSFSGVDQPTTDATSVTTTGLDLTYARPTEKTKVNNYLFDTFGPYPMVSAGIAAGIDQFDNAPPEWNQGAEGFGKRFGSDFAIAAIGTTTRYGLSEAFKEDALYYRCDCRGVLPRIDHAVVSAFTARRGMDGHRVFSLPALVAPYAGSFTAVYAWYPDRFGAKDAFRMGNYSMLEFVAENISLEFLYSGPHSLLSRMHLNNAHGSPVQGPNQ